MAFRCCDTTFQKDFKAWILDLSQKRFFYRRICTCKYVKSESENSYNTTLLKFLKQVLTPKTGRICMHSASSEINF